jgi:HD-like signal output (HDOD) protein
MTPERSSVADTASFQNRAERDAQALLKTLEEQSAAGDTELPCFPQTAVRLQHLLADPEADVGHIMQVITFDAVLTGRVLQLANSAALNTTGRRIGDLKTAINRIGFDLIRSAVIAHGMQQLTRTIDGDEMRVRLEALWDRSALMAAMSFVLAKRCPSVNRDHAMLGGLLHGVGKLYVLTRAAKHPFILQDRARLLGIERQWHGSCAQAILTAWRITPEVIFAISHYEDLNREAAAGGDLTDVLTVSYLLVGYVARHEALAPAFEKIKSFGRLGLSYESLSQSMLEAQDEIEALHRGLI